jgi:ribosomal protein S18 acetylase RimI-like enzyme
VSRRRGIYDNMKTAVEAIFLGKARQYNRRFLQMCSHHLIEPVACSPASGWEKGQVENQVGNLRDQLFRPKPRVGSLVELNGWLETASLDGDIVRTVFVAPDVQSRGVGRRLMHELERRARTKGITKLSVPSSITAEPFYAKLGFAPVRDVHHETELTIIMERRL